MKILDVLKKEAININLTARDKKGVLDELVAPVASSAGATKDQLVKVLLERERLGSTGIGKGIAIPHGRTTSAAEITIAFGKSRDGVDYESIDGKPVHLVFMIIAPPQDENNMYLPILGKMVEVLSKSKNRNKLIDAESFSEFIEVIEKG